METTTSLPVVAEMQPVQINESPRMVVVDEISVDPKQPRKTYNKVKFEELVASVKVHRVLQSLLLRPNPQGGYLLVFGERRWKAAKIAGLNEVPAMIRDIPDNVAREMQLIENLQREDVHPMEQAQGFLSLIEESNMDPQEIAIRIGKSVYFVRQHLKLNSLFTKWQAIFLKNGISLTTALQICTLPDEAQTDLYSSLSKDDENSNQPIISINEWLFKRYNGNLRNACFDINDPELDKQRGACTSCPFNSALASLFPDDEKHPTCKDVVCFKNKTNIHVTKELAKAKEEPSVVLVYDDYSMPTEIKKIKDEGAEVLKLGYGGECQPIREPQKPVLENYMKEGKREKKSEKKIKAEFKTAEETYEFEKEVFDKKLATGKYKKAFVAHSDSEGQTGKYVYVELNPKTSGKKTKKAVYEGDPTIEDINTEIECIKQREKRAKELDQEKVHVKVVEAVKSDKNITVLPQKMGQTDAVLFNFLLWEYISSYNKENIQKIIKPVALWKPNNPEQFYTSLSSLTKNQIAFLVRQVIIDKYSSNLPNTLGGYMLRKMAESLGSIPITDFENEQKEIAQKRQGRVNKNIGILQEMKKELLNKSKKGSNNKSTEKKEKIRA